MSLPTYQNRKEEAMSQFHETGTTYWLQVFERLDALERKIVEINTDLAQLNDELRRLQPKPTPWRDLLREIQERAERRNRGIGQY